MLDVFLAREKLLEGLVFCHHRRVHLHGRLGPSAREELKLKLPRHQVRHRSDALTKWPHAAETALLLDDSESKVDGHRPIRHRLGQ